MAFTNRTQNLGLPQWLPDDKPTWLVDMNGAFNDIDTAITGDRGSISSLDSKVTNQGITIASNTEASHNNATQIVAINNTLDAQAARITGIDIHSMEAIAQPSFPSRITAKQWISYLFKLNGFYYLQIGLLCDVTAGDTVQVPLAVPPVQPGPEYPMRVSVPITPGNWLTTGNLHAVNNVPTIGFNSAAVGNDMFLFTSGLFLAA